MAIKKITENFNFGNYAANKFQAWGQQLQAAAGTGAEAGGAEVALQGGAKFHVVATRVSRCITPVAKPGAGAAAALRVFPTTTAAPTLHYISAGQHKHTHRQTQLQTYYLSH